jgi:NADH-quinone oxidoreductase subunit J
MFENLNQILGMAYYGLFALVAVVCACGLLIARHPLSGALNLVGVMLSIAGIYALLNSPFLAVLQLLVYAGAIMMLVVFVIMVLNKARDHAVPRFDWFAAVCLLLPIAIGGMLVWGVTRGGLAVSPHAPRAGAEVVAVPLFDVTAGGPGYYLLFELIGILLLVAVVSAVLLAKRTLDTPTDTPADAVEEHH